MEITIGGGDEEKEPEYEHVYEVYKNGPSHRLVGEPEEPPSESEAADIFAVEEDRLTYILSREKDGEDTETVWVKCSNCDNKIPLSHEKAAEIKYSEKETQCRDCANTDCPDCGRSNDPKNESCWSCGADLTKEDNDAQ